MTMRIVHLSTSDSFGGAAIAATRLMRALRKEGEDVKMMVRDRELKDPDIISIDGSPLSKRINQLRFVWERLVIYIQNGLDRSNLFKVSIANTGIDLSRRSIIQKSDIIHLHWINQGFLSLESIKKLQKTGKPIVWTMHDMWPFTGICHHAWECERYSHECGKCPLLNSLKRFDLSFLTLRKKSAINSNIRMVSVSSWLRGKALMSSIAQSKDIKVIPNVIDLEVFHPSDKLAARRKYSLPIEKKIILMGAVRIDDPVKGFFFLKEALNNLHMECGDILLVLLGEVKDSKILGDVSFPIIQLGFRSDLFEVAQLYSAVDVNVVPSFYETFGQTIIEAMACGCPSVSFNNSGQVDVIDHKKNGYLAAYKDAADLATGIDWVLNKADREKLSFNARKKVEENYSEAVVAKQYIDLYRSLLK